MTIASLHVAPADPGGLLLSEVWLPAPHGADHRDGWNLRLAELEAKAQPEQWDDPTEPTGGLPVLSSYLRYTWARIREEGKLVEGTDDRGVTIAAFNTGLFTPHFEPITGLLEANRNAGQQPWVFKEWVGLSDWRLRPLDREALRPAFYFDDPAELIYDPNRHLEPNVDHVLDRLAARWPDGLPDDEVGRRIMLDGAIREAGKRIQMNWRLAVPQYYWPAGRPEGRIQLLLPLRLRDSRPADLALVIDRRDPDLYVGYTILTLSMAYKNARLISRPESDWLSVPASAPEVEEVQPNDATAGWRRVSGCDRCPICGEATKCVMSADNRTAICTRDDSGVPVKTKNDTVWRHDLR